MASSGCGAWGAPPRALLGCGGCPALSRETLRVPKLTPAANSFRGGPPPPLRPASAGRLTCTSPTSATRSAGALERGAGVAQGCSSPPRVPREVVLRSMPRAGAAQPHSYPPHTPTHYHPCASCIARCDVTGPGGEGSWVGPREDAVLLKASQRERGTGRFWPWWGPRGRASPRSWMPSRGGFRGAASGGTFWSMEDLLTPPSGGTLGTCLKLPSADPSEVPSSHTLMQWAGTVLCLLRLVRSEWRGFHSPEESGVVTCDLWGVCRGAGT